MKRFVLLPLVAVLALAGCGGGTHSKQSKHVSAAAIGKACPPGHSHIGCAIAPTKVGATPPPSKKMLSDRGLFPDVYEGQGHVDWSAVKQWQLDHGWQPAGIFKMGEYRLDSYAQNNNDQLRALGMWRAGYWFVRNTGCQSESNQIISEARALGLVVVVNDSEVPEAAGYVACLVPAERAAGLIPVTYTAPGTWPGGSGFGNAPLWQATYGPSFSAFWQPLLAWQCTDGKDGCVTFVPGVGTDDVSVNFGITHLGAAPPPPPPPVCAPYHKRMTVARCRQLEAWQASWTNARNSSLRAFHHYDFGKCQPVLVGPKGCHVLATRVVQFQQLLDSTIPGWVRPHCWIGFRAPGLPVCQVIRPEVSIWSHARASSKQALVGCTATEWGIPPCSVFVWRVKYFNQKAHSTFTAWL